MSAVQACEDFVLFVQKFERSSRQGGYMAAIWKMIQSSVNYQLVRCFPDFPRAAYVEQFTDHPRSDGFTTLSTGVFC